MILFIYIFKGVRLRLGLGFGVRVNKNIKKANRNFIIFGKQNKKEEWRMDQSQ